MLVDNGVAAQSNAADAAAGWPSCLPSGAADSDESVTFEQILAGICGDRNATAAAEELQADLAADELATASEPSRICMPKDLSAGVSFDTNVGPRSAQHGGREPLVESVFFSDSDGDWDQGGRHNKQAAGTCY